MSAQASLAWFARHEARLAWRDAAMMLQGGRRGRGIWAAIGLVVFEAILHAGAYALIEPLAERLVALDVGLRVALTGSALMAWMLLVSQAMETVTRSFYARADLDLILSSPAAARRLFAIRIAANAATTIVMAALLVGPVIDAAAVLAGPRWLCGYLVLAALGATAVAAATGLTVLLFRVAGPKRTRLLAQVVAAVVGAGFVVAIQAVAIFSYGSLSRTAMFDAPEWIARAPGPASPLWWPARAASGDPIALALVVGGAALVLAGAIAIMAPAFARDVTTVAGLPEARIAAAPRRALFRRRSQAGVLRAKEWLLLWRDPWLVSQSLMQVLYLVPPALLLWKDYAADTGGLAVLVPVLVMAAGQLAGGLAWLAISGEDAPDLVATAPIAPRAVLRAKIEAVLMAVALPILPIALAIAWVAPALAAITLGGGLLAASGATSVQLIFKSQAKRSNFRRRQTSSRLATFAEAFVSIALAGAAGLAAAGLWLVALLPIGAAIGILVTARSLVGATR